VIGLYDLIDIVLVHERMIALIADYDGLPKYLDVVVAVAEGYHYV
jgi:hypothetical protein